MPRTVPRLEAGPARSGALPLAVCLVSLAIAGCRFWASPPTRSGPTVAHGELPDSMDALLAVAEARDAEDSPREDLLVAVEAYAKALSLTAAKPSRHISTAEIYWRLARACFLLSEAERNVTEKLMIISRGESAAVSAIRERPDRVEGYYWQAVLLGRRAENSGLGFSTIRLARKVERLALEAERIDPAYEHGGPLRLLAMLYAKAPPWPTSIGDIERALEYADEAVDLVDYPLNRLFRAEVLIEYEDFPAARAELRAVLTAPKIGRWSREGEVWRPYARQLLSRIPER